MPTTAKHQRKVMLYPDRTTFERLGAIGRGYMSGCLHQALAIMADWIGMATAELADTLAADEWKTIYERCKDLSVPTGADPANVIAGLLKDSVDPDLYDRLRTLSRIHGWAILFTIRYAEANWGTVKDLEWWRPEVRQAGENGGK